MGFHPSFCQVLDSKMKLLKLQKYPYPYKCEHQGDVKSHIMYSTVVAFGFTVYQSHCIALNLRRTVWSRNFEGRSAWISNSWFISSLDLRFSDDGCEAFDKQLLHSCHKKISFPYFHIHQHNVRIQNPYPYLTWPIWAATEPYTVWNTFSIDRGTAHRAHEKDFFFPYQCNLICPSVSLIQQSQIIQQQNCTPLTFWLHIMCR